MHSYSMSASLQHFASGRYPNNMVQVIIHSYGANVELIYKIMRGQDEADAVTLSLAGGES